MYNDSDLIALVLNADLNQINSLLSLRLLSEVNAVRQQNDILESRISALEKQSLPNDKEIFKKDDKQNEEIEVCKDLILNRIRQQDSEIEKLRALVDWYCPPDNDR